jgi:hypothetical protein
MFQTAFFTGLGAIVGAAGSIVIIPFAKDLPTELQLSIAAFLGAVCSSILVCREKSIQKKLGRNSEAEKKGLLAKIKTILFWLVLIGGLAAVAIAGLKIYGKS